MTVLRRNNFSSHHEMVTKNKSNIPARPQTNMSNATARPADRSHINCHRRSSEAPWTAECGRMFRSAVRQPFLNSHDI